ncbi:MAG: GNAT family N-acetyltransferase [Candidatus Helarchaeota archaeon]|nr:GNAT family N-acetyltransferase [Candidatus Helarchaeota archaeon]
MNKISIKNMNDINLKQAIKVAESLKHKAKEPKWFDPEAIETMKKEFRNKRGYVAIVNNNVVGFISYKLKEEGLELSWIGVLEKYHRKGIGKKLIEKLLMYAKEKKCKYIDVETVAPHHADENYKKTIAFYKKIGFKVVKILEKADKGMWDMISMKLELKL